MLFNKCLIYIYISIFVYRYVLMLYVLIYCHEMEFIELLKKVRIDLILEIAYLVIFNCFNRLQHSHNFHLGQPSRVASSCSMFSR